MYSLDQQKNSLTLAILKNIPRIFVGLVLLATGIGKALDMAGFVYILEAYQIMPLWMSKIFAYSLPFIEFFTGLSLLLFKQPIKAAWMAVCLHAVFLAVVSITYYRGIPLENCGCFGVFLARPLTIQTLFEDLFMLIMSILALKQALPYIIKSPEIAD